MRGHWRHLGNMTELVLPSAHQSPKPKWQIDRFSHFWTTYRRVSLGKPGHVLSPNNSPLSWGSGPHLIHAFLDPPKSITHMASRSVQPFLHCSRQSVPIIYNGPPLSLSKLPLPMERCTPHPVHYSLGPSDSLF